MLRAVAEIKAGYMTLLQVLLRPSGGLLDITKLAGQTELSRPTVMHYLEICESTLTIHLLRPYHAGKAREWTHQPKAYAFDTGFICDARGWDQVRPEDCGSLWEHLVLAALLSVEDPAKVMFWRDHQQREVDFVVPQRVEPGARRIDGLVVQVISPDHLLSRPGLST